MSGTGRGRGWNINFYLKYFKQVLNFSFCKFFSHFLSFLFHFPMFHFIPFFSLFMAFLLHSVLTAPFFLSFFSHLVSLPLSHTHFLSIYLSLLEFITPFPPSLSFLFICPSFHLFPIFLFLFSLSVD